MPYDPSQAIDFDGYKEPVNFNDLEGLNFNGAPSIVDTMMGDQQKDQIILKLRHQNGVLREKLKELNQALDQALEKAQKNMNKKGYQQLPPNIETLLKTKEREMQNQEQQIQNLKKEVHMLRQKLDIDAGVEKQIRLETNLKEAEKRNQELVREIKALQKIQNEQGKALDKITNQNDYNMKIKNLMDELKVTKEKYKEVDEKQRREEKTNRSQFEQVIRLEEKCKELKAQNQALISGGQIQLKPITKQDLDEKDKQIEELKSQLQSMQKNIELFERVRDSDHVKMMQLKKKHEIQIQDLISQLEFLGRGYKEKDQEN
eukprot:403349157